MKNCKTRDGASKCKKFGNYPNICLECDDKHLLVKTTADEIYECLPIDNTNIDNCVTLSYTEDSNLNKVDCSLCK